MKFLEVARKIAEQKIPSLPPATGERRVFNISGKGWLEIRDGTRVMFLVGTPEEIVASARVWLCKVGALSFSTRERN